MLMLLFYQVYRSLNVKGGAVGGDSKYVGRFIGSPFPVAATCPAARFRYITLFPPLRHQAHVLQVNRFAIQISSLNAAERTADIIEVYIADMQRSIKHPTAWNGNS